MTTLNSLSPLEEKHWKLHLNAAVRDNPSVKKVVDGFLMGGELPNIGHPSFIHDWLEHPERRLEIENG